MLPSLGENREPGKGIVRPENQTDRAAKIPRGRPRKVDPRALDEAASRFVVRVVLVTGEVVLAASRPDPELARELTEALGVSLTPDDVYRWRKRNNVAACKDPDLLERLMEQFVDCTTALATDPEIAERISETIGADLTADAVQKWRKKNGVASCNGRGGPRPGAGRPKREEEDFDEDYEWLLRHFDLVFPFRKRRGLPDEEFAWFACACSGIEAAKNDPRTPRDLKAAIRNAEKRLYDPTFYVEVRLEEDSGDDFAQGGGKKGKGGSRSDRNLRHGLLR